MLSKPLIPAAILAVLSLIFLFTSFAFVLPWIRSLTHVAKRHCCCWPLQCLLMHWNNNKKLFFQIFLRTRFLLCHNMTIVTMSQPPICSDSQISLRGTAHWNIKQVYVSGFSITFTLHYISYVNSSSSCRNPSLKLGWNSKQWRFQVWPVAAAVCKQHLCYSSWCRAQARGFAVPRLQEW